VSIHPGRDTASPEQILRVFMEAGGDAGKVAMCHLDRMLAFIGKMTRTIIFILFKLQQALFSAIKICLILPLLAPSWNSTYLVTNALSINLIDLLICLLTPSASVIFTN